MKVCSGVLFDTVVKKSLLFCNMNSLGYVKTPLN